MSRYFPLSSTLEDFTRRKEDLELLSIYPREFAEPIPKEYRMSLGSTVCTSRALYAYNQTTSCASVLSPEEMLKYGPTHIFYKQYPFGSHYSALYSNGLDCITPYLIYFQDVDIPEADVSSVERPEWFASKCILILYHAIFYPNGHCIVIYPPAKNFPNVWCLQDPIRKDGTHVSLSRKQLSLLFAFADVILW